MIIKKSVIKELTYQKEGGGTQKKENKNMKLKHKKLEHYYYVFLQKKIYLVEK